MNKKSWYVLGILVIGLVIVASCGNRGWFNPIKGIPASTIEWVDFVKLDNGKYTGVTNVVLADPSLVTGDIVGEVEFKVADVVTNSRYRIQTGDAAYLDIGTKLYRIAGFDTNVLIAAENARSINGYSIYKENNAAYHYPSSLTEIAAPKIEKMEWYSSTSTELLAELDAEQSEVLADLLQAGVSPNPYSVSKEDRKPVYYRLVMYVGEPLAYYITIVDDGEQVMFYDYDGMKQIDSAIKQWLPEVEHGTSN